MKRILLTGGTGFLGSQHLEQYLKETDWEIVILDGLTYAGDLGRVTDIDAYDPSRVTILWHDLRSAISPTLDHRIGHIDYVVSMASESHVDRSIAEPVPFIHNNVMLVTNLLEWARSRPEIKSFIQIGTDEVFGPAKEGYSHKEWDPILPSNPYAASKASQDAICYSYYRTYNMPIVMTHCMNLFGERQGSEKFIPIVIRNLINHTPVPVHAGLSDGKWVPGSRVWIHARNHADAILWLLERTPTLYSDEAGKPDSFNIAGDKDLRNDDMVRLIANILKVEPIIEYQDFHSSRPGHDLRYSLDNSKLKNAGWVMPVPFKESLRKTIEWTLKHDQWLK